MLVFFQDQYPGAFAHYEPIAACIPWTRGSSRIIIACGQSTHGGEAGDRKRGDRCFAATADHHVRVAPLNYPERLADSVRARSARSGAGEIGAGRAIANRDLAGSKIGDGSGNEKG